MCGNEDYNLMFLDPLIGYACKIHDQCYDSAVQSFTSCNIDFAMLVAVIFGTIIGLIAFLGVQIKGKKYYKKIDTKK